MKSLLKLPYSLFVIVSKHTLIGLTAVLCITVITIAVINQRSGGARLVLSGNSPNEVQRPIMEKPHYRGLDSKNRPFLVTAETARDEGNKVYRLYTVVAHLASGTSDETKLSSDTALYTSETEELDLNGNVLLDARGYQFATEAATIFTKDNTARGNKEINGKGPAGTINAQRFEILDGGDKIVFAGNVKVNLTPRPKKTQ